MNQIEFIKCFLVCLALLFFYPAISLSVFLEFQDKEGTRERSIFVHFQDEVISEGTKRIEIMLQKRGISFTEMETCSKNANGATHYFSAKKDYFKSSRKETFREWIDKAPSIHAFHFTGIDGEYEIASVVSAFNLLSKMMSTLKEVDGFYLIEGGVDLKEEATELDTFKSGEKSSLTTFVEKFKGTKLIFKGTRVEEAIEAVKKVLDEKLPELKKHFVFE